MFEIRDVTTGKIQLRHQRWWAESAPRGGDRVKVSENLGVTSVAPVDASLVQQSGDEHPADINNDRFKTAKKMTGVTNLFLRFYPEFLCLQQTKSQWVYSHFSNKREAALTDFEKKSTHHAHFHPPRLLISQILSTLYSSFIAVMYYFFPKKHPPRLLMLQLLHPLHVYPNLLGCQRDESKH